MQTWYQSVGLYQYIKDCAVNHEIQHCMYCCHFLSILTTRIYRLQHRCLLEVVSEQSVTSVSQFLQLSCVPAIHTVPWRYEWKAVVNNLAEQQLLAE